MPTLSTTTHIDVDLLDFTSDELRDELDARGESTSRDISNFSDKELFAEVEARGHFVASKPTNLTQSDIELLMSMFPSHYKIGGDEYFVYEKLVRFL